MDGHFPVLISLDMPPINHQHTTTIIKQSTTIPRYDKINQHQQIKTQMNQQEWGLSKNGLGSAPLGRKIIKKHTNSLIH